LIPYGEVAGLKTTASALVALSHDIDAIHTHLDDIARTVNRAGHNNEIDALKQSLEQLSRAAHNASSHTAAGGQILSNLADHLTKLQSQETTLQHELDIQAPTGWRYLRLPSAARW
jgi:ABC-type transporter Mla subunit MlaD